MSEIQTFKHNITDKRSRSSLEANSNNYMLGEFDFHGTTVFYFKDVEVDKSHNLKMNSDLKPIPKTIKGQINFKLTYIRIPKEFSFHFIYQDKDGYIINRKKMPIHPAHEDPSYEKDLSGYFAYRITEPGKRIRTKGRATRNSRNRYIPLDTAGSNCADPTFGGCDSKYQILFKARKHYFIPMITMSHTLAYFATEQMEKIEDWVKRSSCLGVNKDKIEDDFVIGVTSPIYDDNIWSIPFTKNSFLIET